MKRRLITLAGTGSLLLVFGGYIAYPLCVLVLESLQAGGSWSVQHYASLLDLSNRGNLEAVWNSVLVSLLSVVFSALLGGALAFTVTQFDFPLRRLLSRFAVLPVALPPLVGVIAFLFVFGETGIIPRGLQMLFRSTTAPLAMDGISGVVLVHVYSFHVYFYLFCSAALRAIDASQLEAAAGLGSGSWRSFRAIILPKLRPALVGGAALTFMASMASFTAPLLFAGEKRFITLQIYQTKLNGDLDLAAAQSVLLTMISVAFYGVLLASMKGREWARGGKGAGRTGVLRVPRGVRRIAITLITILVAIETLPMLAIILLSFAREGAWTIQLLPSSYTLANYRELFSDPARLDPLLNSLLLAGLTLLAALFFGVSSAFLSTSGRNRVLGKGVQIALTLPYAVPGTTVAIALILAFNAPTPMAGGTILVGTFWILPLAYFMREYPLIVRSTTASLEQFDEGLLEAADGLGAGAVRKFRLVVLPAILPGIVGGGVLVVIAALGEFVSSILLYTYGSRPVSVEILSQLRLFNIGAAAAYSVVLMVVILFLIRLTGSSTARESQGGMISGG